MGEMMMDRSVVVVVVAVVAVGVHDGLGWRMLARWDRVMSFLTFDDSDQMTFFE